MSHKAKANGLMLAQAKVIRANGSVEYHYSLPDCPWWNVRRRVRRRLLIAWARMNLEG